VSGVFGALSQAAITAAVTADCEIACGAPGSATDRLAVVLTVLVPGAPEFGH